MKTLLLVVSIAFALISLIDGSPATRELNEIFCENLPCLNDPSICICGTMETPEDRCGCPLRCRTCSFGWTPLSDWGLNGLVFPEIDWAALALDFANLNLNLGKK